MATNMTFIDYITPIPADWLNNVNTVVNASQTAINSIILNLAAYGAKGDGSTDNTAAWNAAIAAATYANQVLLIFPAGTFVFNSSIAATIGSGIGASITIMGQGQDTTKLVFPNSGNGITINVPTQYQSFHVKDLSITTGTAGTGIGLNLLQQSTTIGNPADTAQSDIINVTFRGSDGYAQTDYWSFAVNSSGVSNINFFNVMMVGNNAGSPAGEGFSVGGTATLPPVVFNFFGCSFNNLNIGINYGNYVQGVFANGCNFTYCNSSIFVASGLTNLDQLSVTNCQFGPPPSGASIGIQTWVPFTMINNNLFFVNGTGSALAIITGLTTITGNTFHGDNAGHCNGVVALSTNSTNPSVITGNVFNALNTAVALNPGTQYINVQSNAYQLNTTNVNNLGTNNTIGGGSQ